MTDTAKALHQEILADLKKHSGNGTQHTGNVSYLGNAHFSYHISVPLKRIILKDFIKNHPDLEVRKFIELLNILYKGTSHDEKAIAGMLIGYLSEHRAALDPRLLNSWLNHIEGWAEIDSLCQSNFTAEEMLSAWKTWEALLLKFSKNKNIAKRRASLVLLTGPVSKSDDPRFVKLAFKNIETLQSEKDILITKAISWLLRSMVKRHKKAVALFLQQNSDRLPAIAIRETQRKIKTGRK